MKSILGFVSVLMVLYANHLADTSQWNEAFFTLGVGIVIALWSKD